uniref:Uncharacterized protein n=1 Tax=Picea glauca TaxID=3330 RepID=A0A101LVQ2_PICGL|nr:hypothetical protein ABT39_MTgene2136 [Picea glauca]QHR86895.1 hypothetical protein Q903MT_gene902 [Picea sitchensis]
MSRFPHSRAWPAIGRPNRGRLLEYHLFISLYPLQCDMDPRFWDPALGSTFPELPLGSVRNSTKILERSPSTSL